MSRAGRTNVLLILRLLRHRNLDFPARNDLIILPMFCPNRDFLPHSLPKFCPWVNVGSFSGQYENSSAGRLKALCISSPFVLLYCSCVEPAPRPTLQLRRSVQGMRRGRSRPGRDHARQLDCCRLSVVWNEEALPAIRKAFRGLTLTQVSWWAATGGALMGEMKRAIAREEQDRQTQSRVSRR